MLIQINQSDELVDIASVDMPANSRNYHWWRELVQLNVITKANNELKGAEVLERTLPAVSKTWKRISCPSISTWCWYQLSAKLNTLSSFVTYAYTDSVKQ